MDGFDDTLVGNRMKRNNSIGKLNSGERNYTLSSNNNLVTHSLKKNAKCSESRKRATEIGEPARQKWHSLLDEVSLQRSRAAQNNGRNNSDDNTDKNPDNLMARELHRLQQLKMEVMRANDKRRKSYAGFGHRKLSVLGGNFPKESVAPAVTTTRTSDKKDVPEERSRRRRITVTFPIESRDTLQLPQIQPLHFKAGQNRRVTGANRNHEGVQKTVISVGERKRSDEIEAETKSKSKQDEHELEAEQWRYGSPLPQVNKSQKLHISEDSARPQITVSDYVDLNSRVKTFVKKPQPIPSEMSLRMKRSTVKLPSIESVIRQKTNTSEGAKRAQIINTVTCPPISFYGDRSWYYQDKRRKCRYLRVPDSPAPPIHSVFEKD